MTEFEIQNIIEKQKKFFATGKTLDIKYRMEALKKLKATIEKYEVEIGKSIKSDLGKSSSESFMCEIGLVKSEISYMIKHIKKYAKERTVKTPITNWISRSFVKPVP
ncbi:MAG: aldehyde dehydrogenase family protein, partial [Clostridia bacterium]|nr:aldehyde dehydrogenase family protein [Clostridia bacterium]